MKTYKWSLPCVYPEGYIIEQEGTLCERIGLIIKGSVDLIHYNDSGDQALLATLQKGDTFGDILLFSNDPIYPGHLIASKDTEVKFMNRNKVNHLLETDHVFRQNFIKNLSNKANTFNFLNKLYQQPTLEKKIIYYLDYHMLKHDQNYVTINSVSTWANILGVQRPSLSRTLSALIQSNKIKRTHKQYRLMHKP